jgi:hypothetical protein
MSNNEYSVSYKPKKKLRINLKLTFSIILALFFLSFILGGVWVMNGKPKLKVLGSKDEKVTEDENTVNALVDEVSKIMLLPSETPIVATVDDVSKVNNQKFFANAQVGDKVLVFQSDKKAVLYRPSEKRVIEVGFVRDNTDQADTASGSPSPSPTPRYDFSYSDNVQFIDDAAATPSPSPAATTSP